MTFTRIVPVLVAASLAGALAAPAQAQSVLPALPGLSSAAPTQDLNLEELRATVRTSYATQYPTAVVDTLIESEAQDLAQKIADDGAPWTTDAALPSWMGVAEGTAAGTTVLRIPRYRIEEYLAYRADQLPDPGPEGLYGIGVSADDLSVFVAVLGAVS